ncbi:putative lipoprotein [Leptospira terpstrae serovar Hualin str. LT 11-33 = ATCC 700639]|uniref:Lipoprotein n=1 Tax=Leptospira terpstrae serovar Hualin str. LT 11-33 = ATCC 700639 TaxID=1257025 RepID=N1VWX7_9LEPT|nr:putative lipoprotein [Leptospira terpstrae serovar Hualin str. LT 11-33 = ATCC 700639]
MFKMYMTISFCFIFSSCLYNLNYITKIDETEKNWKTEEKKR